MAKYIPLDALVAEIESKFQKYWKKGEESDALQDGNAKYWGGVLSCLNEVKTLINTLEVKEVDLEKELDRIWFDNKLGNYFDNDALDFAHIRTLCRHFFELGMQVSNKAQKGE